MQSTFILAGAIGRLIRHWNILKQRRLFRQRLISLFSALKAEETQLVPKLALNYPPSTRALTGALLEKTGNEKYTQELKKSLNPITVYKLGIQDKVLSTVKNWNIQ